MSAAPLNFLIINLVYVVDVISRNRAGRFVVTSLGQISKILGEKAWIGVLAGGVVLATLLVFVDVMKSRLVNAEVSNKRRYSHVFRREGDHTHTHTPTRARIPPLSRLIRDFRHNHQ